MSINKLLKALMDEYDLGDESNFDEDCLNETIGTVIANRPVGIETDPDFSFVEPIIQAHKAGWGFWDLKDLVYEAFNAYLKKYPLKMINLTPHAVVVGRDSIVGTYGGQELCFHEISRYEPSGQLARISMEENFLEHIGYLAVYSENPGRVVGLPNPVPNTWYIVSSMVRTALPERKDLLSPGRAHRDSDGKIVGVYHLVGNP